MVAVAGWDHTSLSSQAVKTGPQSLRRAAGEGIRKKAQVYNIKPFRIGQVFAISWLDFDREGSPYLGQQLLRNTLLEKRKNKTRQSVQGTICSAYQFSDCGNEFKEEFTGNWELPKCPANYGAASWWNESSGACNCPIWTINSVKWVVLQKYILDTSL